MWQQNKVGQVIMAVDTGGRQIGQDSQVPKGGNAATK